MPTPNPKIILFSILALAFVALTYLVRWEFIIGAVVFMLLNQRELMKARKNKKR
jgi:hypothetical protein